MGLLSALGCPSLIPLILGQVKICLKNLISNTTHVTSSLSSFVVSEKNFYLEMIHHSKVTAGCSPPTGHLRTKRYYFCIAKPKPPVEMHKAGSLLPHRASLCFQTQKLSLIGCCQVCAICMHPCNK